MAVSQPRVEKDSEDCSLLPLVHDVIKCMDKDKDGQDVHQELMKLKTKIQKAREQISNMPGIDSSPQEQQQQLATLREQIDGLLAHTPSWQHGPGEQTHRWQPAHAMNHYTHYTNFLPGNVCLHRLATRTEKL
uniref:Mediator of RNA polymerase II transcription subunit 9 n=1 Tax=Poecilia reticulata TaxID=8081 RepID=A0A3P9MZM6_POERE